MKKNILTGALLVFLFISAFSLKHQMISTSLRITVRDDIGNVVDQAKVTLYANEDDFTSKENAVADTVTNEKGEARFRDLQPVPYFVDVRKDDLSNEDGGVRVQRLEKGKINKITIIIQ